jgi:hypothetical protein
MGIQRREIMKTVAMMMISVVALAFAACGGAIDASTDSDSLALGGKNVSGTTAYYSVRPDYRKCMYPMCGGLWIKRQNRDLTKCVDGTSAYECYVVEADYAALGLTDEELQPLIGAVSGGQAVVKAKLQKKTIGTFGVFGVLKVLEGWLPPNANAPTGTFYSVYDNGIRCITYPCFSLGEQKLNFSTGRNLSGLDLTGSGATQEQLTAAYARIGEGYDVIVAGDNVKVPKAGPAGTGVTLVGTQFYLQVLPQ